MGLNRYTYSALIGASFFVFQLWTVITPELAGLNPHIQASSAASLQQPAAFGPLLILFGYLLLGLAAHVAPLLATARVHADLQSRGPDWLQAWLARRGTLTIALLITLMLMVIANHALFPLSIALPHADLLLNQRASAALVYGLPALSLLACGYWLLHVPRRRIQVITAMALALGATAWAVPNAPAPSLVARERPDLIVIGVDSLRPDHLRAFGYPGPSPAPVVDMLVAGSVRFEQAYTPLARTFVAYTSLLTGQYPTTHGARENLYPPDRIGRQDSIAHLLGEQGYASLFAMDEARFANFDRGFGFDRVIAPPPGVLDFVAGSMLDTVGTNLLLLLPYSDWLLPHIAGNRAAASTYRPDAHSARLARAVNSLDPGRPWLLVSHFCIAHWPYARNAVAPEAPAGVFADSPGRYRGALGVADGQVERLLGQLRALGRLDNAIVVLLSDHGEGLGMAKDDWALVQPDGSSERAVHHGHGKPALDQAQSRVLLSFQRYRAGEPVWRGRELGQTVSLVDVAPTLLRLANVDVPPGRFDGEALLNSSGDAAVAHDRPVYIESGISGTSLQIAEPDDAQVANELGHLYRVTPDFRIEMSAEEIPAQLRNKQRAVIKGRHGLSSEPAQSTRADCWLKLDLKTNRAECLPISSQDPVVQAYSYLLCQHYSGDSKFHARWCGIDRDRPKAAR